MNFIDYSTIQTSYSDGGQVSVVFGKNFNFRNPDLDPCVIKMDSTTGPLVVDYAEGTLEGENAIQLALHIPSSHIEDFIDGLPAFLLVLVNGEGRLYSYNGIGIES